MNLKIKLKPRKLNRRIYLLKAVLQNANGNSPAHIRLIGIVLHHNYNIYFL